MLFPHWLAEKDLIYEVSVEKLDDIQFFKMFSILITSNNNECLNSEWIILIMWPCHKKVISKAKVAEC